MGSLIRVSLGQKCSIHSVWHVGMQYSWMFVISLNIGALGYFWWYRPVFVSKFYEEILDLENNAAVSLDRNPPLVVALNNQALKESELSNVSLVFVHLAQVNAAQRLAYDKYFRAIGLLAKNDIFGQFEHMVMVEFYEAFRLGLLGYGDLDAETANLASAAEKLFDETRVGSEFIVELVNTLSLAGELKNDKQPKQPITLDEVAKMKAFCNVYFILRAKKDLKQQA